MKRRKPGYAELRTVEMLFQRWSGKLVSLQFFPPDQLQRLRTMASARNPEAMTIMASFGPYLADWKNMWCTPCRRAHVCQPASLIVLTPNFEDPLMPEGMGSAMFAVCPDCTADPLLMDRWVAIMKGELRERALAQAMHPSDYPVNDDSAQWPVTHGWGRA